MDDDEYGNFSNFDRDIIPGRSAGEIAQEIIFVIFCTVGVCANVAIIYTIIRFKRMRIIPYIFLANWAIADLCSLLVNPSGYRLIYVLDNTSMSPTFICSLRHFGSVLHFNVVLFVIILSVDWFIAAYFTHKSEMIRSYYRYIIAATWITSLLFCGLTTGLCFGGTNTYFSHFMLFFSFWVLLIGIILLQSSRAVRKYYLNRPLDCSSEMLTLTTVFIGCWFPSFFTHFIGGLTIDNIILHTISGCILFSNPIVNITILYRSNKNFQACLHQAVKRPGSGYEDSSFDFENPLYKNSIVKDKTPVKIDFEAQDELLMSNEY